MTVVGQSKRLASIKNNLNVVLSDKDRKSIPRILKEFIHTSIKTNCIATHYFTSHLYKKDIHNYIEYLSHHEWQHLQREMCDSVTYVILGDKLYFHFFFENFKIPMPCLLAYTIREGIAVNTVHGWKKNDITSIESFHEVINDVLLLSSGRPIFIKPSVSSGGSGIVRIAHGDDIRGIIDSSNLYSAIRDGAFIIQEEVQQHSELAKLNSHTLNTIRIDTFKPFGGIPEVISAYMRIGRSSSHVDNLTSGGLRVGIDSATARLKEFGTSNLYRSGMRVTAHPDTKVTFKDFPVPFFREVEKLAIEAANCLPQSLIGWDIAISETGPVLIEGNTVYYATQGSDIAYGGYRRNPTYQKVVDYVRNASHKKKTINR